MLTSKNHNTRQVTYKSLNHSLLIQIKIMDKTSQDCTSLDLIIKIKVGVSQCVKE